MPRRRRPSRRLLRSQVEHRARGRCEYCRAPQRVCGYRFHLEHIVPSSEGGSDALFNRALACAPCNLAKSNRTSAVDPGTGNLVPLFNPRTQAWDDHLGWAGDRASLIGVTPTGRATVVALDLNSDFRRQSRRFWFATGRLP